MQLYEKSISKGGKVVYKPYTPPSQAPVVMNINDREALTIVASLGMMLIMLFERHIPSHTRNMRKIKTAEKALFQLFDGTGEKLDPALVDWVLSCWDETMRRAEGLPADGGQREAA